MIQEKRLHFFYSGGVPSWPPCDKWVTSVGFWGGGILSESLNSADAFVLKRL